MLVLGFIFTLVPKCSLNFPSRKSISALSWLVTENIFFSLGLLFIFFVISSALRTVRFSPIILFHKLICPASSFIASMALACPSLISPLLMLCFISSGSFKRRRKFVQQYAICLLLRQPVPVSDCIRLLIFDSPLLLRADLNLCAVCFQLKKSQAGLLWS